MRTLVADPPRRRNWLEQALAWRDRFLASRRSQSFFAAFPLTRPIARRGARELFDLCAGFVYSQVLAACVRLRVFEELAPGPLTLDELAHRLGLSQDVAERLLNAAVSLRLLSLRAGERYGLGPLGAAMLGNPGVAAMVEHHEILYRDLVDPVALLQSEGSTSELSRYWTYASTSHPATLGDAQVCRYSRLMGASQAILADEVLHSYPVHRHRRLLDVGGGDGSFVLAVAERLPRIEIVSFDLPAVAALAKQRYVAAGVQDRVHAVGGDFFGDPLPNEADLVTLNRIIHDYADEQALDILQRVRRALPAGGVLLLAEPMAEAAHTDPVSDAYLGLYLLAMGPGRPRTPKALTHLLRAAGFDEVRQLRTRMPMLLKVLEARVSKKM